MKGLGKALYLHRMACGLKQTELAKRLNVSVTTISRYESDKQSLTADKLSEIADIFGVSVSDIIKTAEGDTQHITTKDEAKVIAALRNLNAEGRSTAIDRIIELQKIPDYKK